ncbi:hypothetical protein BDW22DRAFT_1311212, partial [Trametopsis cervina]
ANRIIREGIVICGKMLQVRKSLPDPRRCLKCQQIGVRHLAAQCTAPHSTCGTCGKTDHMTNQCNETDKRRFRCVNCNETGHGAWDRMCPHFIRKKQETMERVKESQYRYFPTAGDPSTWEIIH